MTRIACALLSLFIACPILSYDWATFKKQMMSADGRIIDYQNNEVSHSEGQGYGMILAVLNKDEAAFNLIWQWTQNNLQVRKTDTLFAWQWGRAQDGNWRVLDYNTASDGVLLIIWALAKASTQFKRPELFFISRQISETIKSKTIINHSSRLLLLPGVFGFEETQRIKFNPSYFIYPAFKLLEEMGQKDFWRAVYQDSLYFTNQSLSGAYKLPPDWATLDSVTNTVTPWAETFSYDAVRIPLYMAMAGDKQALKPFADIIDKMYKEKVVPAKICLVKMPCPQEEGPAGFYALWGLAAQVLGKQEAAAFFWKEAQNKIAYEGNNYYSAALYLLSKEFKK